MHLHVDIVASRCFVFAHFLVHATISLAYRGRFFFGNTSIARWYGRKFVLSEFLRYEFCPFLHFYYIADVNDICRDTLAHVQAHAANSHAEDIAALREELAALQQVLDEVDALRFSIGPNPMAVPTCSPRAPGPTYPYVGGPLATCAGVAPGVGAQRRRAPHRRPRTTAGTGQSEGEKEEALSRITDPIQPGP